VADIAGKVEMMGKHASGKNAWTTQSYTVRIVPVGGCVELLRHTAI
jgi:hypothetical protein